MQLNQMNAKVSASPLPLSAQRLRTGMSSAVRIGSRCTIPPLTRNVNKADMAPQGEVNTGLLTESSFLDEEVTLADAQRLVSSTSGEGDDWLNDSMPPLSALKPPLQPEAQSTQNEQQVETHVNSKQSSFTSEPEPETYIRPGHPLWPAVSRLSTRIWEELVQVRGRMPGHKRGMNDFVRRRSLALLHAEPELAGHIHNLAEVEQVLQSVAGEVWGYGPLEGLLRDENVSEIMVVGPRLTFVEREGKIREVRYHFEDERHMMRIVENILWRAGRYGELQRPMIDVRLPDGTLEACEIVSAEEERGAMRDLVINALRMQPGRLIVGECRGDEMAKLFQAMHAGYDGSMTTSYARHTLDCLSRLEMMWLMGEARLALPTIRAQIGRCLNLIIHTGYASDGSRKVLDIVEVQGVDGDSVKLQSIYRYVDAGVDEKTGRGRGAYEPQGVHPTCFKVAASAR